VSNFGSRRVALPLVELTRARIWVRSRSSRRRERLRSGNRVAGGL